MRRKIFLRSISLYVVMAGMFLAGCSDGDDVEEVTTTDRPWVMEEEFQQNPALRATPDQIIVLNLEPAPQGDPISLLRNTIPYLVRSTDGEHFSFCIPAEEPYLVALELETSVGETVMRTERGDECAPVLLPAGQYRMHMFHDGSGVAPPGKKAFLRRTNQVRLTGSREAGSEFTTPDWDFFTFKDKYMNFVTVDADKDRALAATSTYAHPIDLSVFLPGKWGISAVPTCFQATEESVLTTSIAQIHTAQVGAFEVGVLQICP